MQVTSTTSTTGTTSATTATSATAAAAKSNTVDYNQFLQLLIAQLKNQDPTSPADPTQFVSQLASFSSVEQAVQTNVKLDSMLTGNALSQAEAAIGRTATSSDGQTTGTVVSVNIAAGGALTAVLSSGQTLALGSGVTIS